MQTLPIVAGGLVTIALDLTTITAVQIALIQASYKQDFALRAWISAYANGPALGGYYPVYKANGFPLLVFSAPPLLLPAQGIAYPVTSPLCVLNVRNLTNEADVLGCEIVPI